MSEPINPCGGRNGAFGDFKTAHAKAKPGDYIAMVIDSEDPLADVEESWGHLRGRDRWVKPANLLGRGMSRFSS